MKKIVFSFVLFFSIILSSCDFLEGLFSDIVINRCDFEILVNIDQSKWGEPKKYYSLKPDERRDFALINSGIYYLHIKSDDPDAPSGARSHHCEEIEVKEERIFGTNWTIKWGSGFFGKTYVVY